MSQEIRPDLAEVRQAMRRFAQERLEPVAQALDAGETPPAWRGWLAEQGYLGMRLPSAFGGAETDLSTYCLANEEFSRIHRVFTLVLDATSGLTPIAIARHGTPAQQQRWLPGLCDGAATASFGLTEPDAGSDAAAIRTRARRGDGGWVLSGTKHYISGAHRAAVIMVIAVTDPALGARGGITAFLVPQGTPGMVVSRVDRTIGSDVVELAELRFEDCFVEDDAVLGDVGQGFAIAMGSLTNGRMSVSASCIGAAHRLIEIAADWARQRHTFGRPLADRQAIQWMLADSTTELFAARAMAYDTLRRADEGEDLGPSASMVKLYCSEMVGRVADRAVQILGGAGLMRGSPVERMYRDVRHYRVGEGSSEVQRLLIARHVLRDGVP